MRLLLLLLLLLVLPGTLPATAKVTALAPELYRAAPVPPDTAAALHHLFERKRKLRRRLVLSTTGVGAALAAIGVVDSGHQRDGLAKGLDIMLAILFGLVAGIMVMVYLVAYDRYSRLHEQRALNWLRYHMLPADLVRELKPEDFEAPPAL